MLRLIKDSSVYCSDTEERGENVSMARSLLRVSDKGKYCCDRRVEIHITMDLLPGLIYEITALEGLYEHERLILHNLILNLWNV